MNSVRNPEGKKFFYGTGAIFSAYIDSCGRIDCVVRGRTIA